MGGCSPAHKVRIGSGRSYWFPSLLPRRVWRGDTRPALFPICPARGCSRLLADIRGCSQTPNARRAERLSAKYNRMTMGSAPPTMVSGVVR